MTWRKTKIVFQWIKCRFKKVLRSDKVKKTYWTSHSTLASRVYFFFNHAKRDETFKIRLHLQENLKRVVRVEVEDFSNFMLIAS